MATYSGFYSQDFTGSTPAFRTYRSRDGGSYFRFKFVQADSHIDIYCLAHPPLGSRDPDPVKTHLYDSGKLCFVAGHEPRSQSEAEERAKQWAEYFLSYRRSGVIQS